MTNVSACQERGLLMGRYVKMVKFVHGVGKVKVKMMKWCQENMTIYKTM